MALSFNSSEEVFNEEIQNNNINKIITPDWDLLNETIDNSLFSTDNIIINYFSEDEISKLKIITITENFTFKNINKDYKINEIINVNIGNGTPPIPPPDDPPSLNKNTELQKEIVNSLKYNNYSKMAKRKYDIKYSKIIQLQQKYTQLKDQKHILDKKPTIFQLLGPIAFYTIPTGIACVFTGLIMLSITNPTSWVIFSKLIVTNSLNNDIYFSTLLNVLNGFGLFTSMETVKVKELYQNFKLSISANKLYDGDKFIEPDLTNLLNISYGIMKNEDGSLKTTSISKEELNNPIYLLFNSIYQMVDSKNIFSDVSTFNNNKNTIDIDWITYIMKVYNSKMGTGILTFLGMVLPITGYLNTSAQLLESYKNVNNLIVLKNTVGPVFNSETFKSINKIASKESFGFLQYLYSQSPKILYGSDVLSGFGSALSFVGITPSSQYFIGIIESSIYVQLTTTATNIFNKMEFEGEKREKIKEQTREDIILSIELEIKQIAEYKKKKMSNEQIAILMDNTDDGDYKSDYNFFIFKYMDIYYNKFKKYNKDPVLFFQTYLGTIALWSSITAITIPTLLGGGAYLLSQAILDGTIYFNFMTLFSSEIGKYINLSIQNIINQLLQAYFGTNVMLTNKYKKLKYKISSDLIYDISIIFNKLKKNDI